MSLKQELENELGSMMYHLSKVQIDKDYTVHGEAGTLIYAVRNLLDDNGLGYIEAFYADKTKMSHEAVAINFADKVHLWLKGTLEEV